VDCEEFQPIDDTEHAENAQTSAEHRRSDAVHEV
jgi:hypothetical protein